MARCYMLCLRSSKLCKSNFHFLFILNALGIKVIEFLNRCVADRSIY